MERFESPAVRSLPVSTCLSRAAAAALFAAIGCVSLSGCGAPDGLQSSSDDLSHLLAPQSLTHGTARTSGAVSFYISGRAGDTVNPAVWPTAGGTNSLVPAMQLFAPSDVSGERALLAQGTADNDDPSTLSLELYLPQTGIYLLSISAQSGQGAFSLRFWTTASHAPRNEAMQVSLLLLPSAAMTSGLAPHGYGGAREGVAWSSNEIDALTAVIRAETDDTVAISDCALLYSTLAVAHAGGLATDALVEKAEHAGADRVGDPDQFAALPASVRTLALYWLGLTAPAVFTSAIVDGSGSDQTSPLGAINHRISALVAGWSGSVEVSAARTITALSRGGVIYGYSADWQALLFDTDGKTEVFSWRSSDYFGADGSWLGESSLGALEPDDD